MKNILYSINELQEIIEVIRKKNQIIGFTNGCFDLLHKGHFHLLNKASMECDFLIVAVNSDLSIKSIKGDTRPIQNEKTRINNLTKMSEIDAIIIFEDDTPLEVIRKLMPHKLFKGSDYRKEDIIGYNIMKRNGGKVILIDLLKGYSTSKIIKKYNTGNKIN